MNVYHLPTYDHSTTLVPSPHSLHIVSQKHAASLHIAKSANEWPLKRERPVVVGDHISPLLLFVFDEQHDSLACGLRVCSVSHSGWACVDYVGVVDDVCGYLCPVEDGWADLSGHNSISTPFKPYERHLLMNPLEAWPVVAYSIRTSLPPIAVTIPLTVLIVTLVALTYIGSEHAHPFLESKPYVYLFFVLTVYACFLWCVLLLLSLMPDWVGQLFIAGVASWGAKAGSWW